jgi:ankyrin repeat protein
MTAATQLAAKTRAGFIAAGPAPVEIAELLITKGAQVNALSKDGVSALMVAAGHNNAPMIGLLLRSGADANLKNSAGQTALDIAKLADHTAAIGAFKVLVTEPRPAGEPQN